MSQAWVTHSNKNHHLDIAVGGEWLLRHINQLENDLAARLSLSNLNTVTIDCSELERLDTSGAWLLHRTVLSLVGKGIQCTLENTSANDRALLDLVQKYGTQNQDLPKHRSQLLDIIAFIGQHTLIFLKEALALIAFVGHSLDVLVRVFRRPKLLRVTSILYQMEVVGVRALPIVGLTSFLIGVVIAYQGATLLKQFGANIYIVDLVSVSILRELGIILTAIIVAGRSGSAFAAQIGSMKVNEELDAMQTIGLNPMIVLLIPRLLALLLTLPLLVFFADMMGLCGGALVSWLTLDINPTLFVQRLQTSVSTATLLVGLIKAPVFAVLIAIVGCFSGFQVSDNAQSVGARTTSAVVLSIFLVIIVDAIFSVFFSEIDF